MTRIVGFENEKKKTGYNRPANNSNNPNTENDIKAFFDPTQEVMELAAEDLRYHFYKVVDKIKSIPEGDEQPKAAIIFMGCCRGDGKLVE